MPPILSVPKNIGKDDILVDLGPNRHPDLPKIYKTKSHPLWNKAAEGNIYYYIQDLSKAGLMKSLKLEHSLCIPHGPEQMAIKMGENHVSPYLMSFSRT